MGTMNRPQLRTRRMKELLVILIGLGLSSAAFNVCYARPSYSYKPSVVAIDSFKLYAHTQLHSSQEYECYVTLINRESHWNYKANDHHGHYGMVQGNTRTLFGADPYYQIDWSIAYIHKRYTYVCTALHHSLSLGWY